MIKQTARSVVKKRTRKNIDIDNVNEIPNRSRYIISFRVVSIDNNWAGFSPSRFGRTPRFQIKMDFTTSSSLLNDTDPTPFFKVEGQRTLVVTVHDLRIEIGRNGDRSMKAVLFVSSVSENLKVFVHKSADAEHESSNYA
eukprot:scaffold9129_cov150-Amphora_coffeaeformis.AAC.4